MREVAICIPTYKRPEMLAKTITSIIGGDITGLDVNRINILVVDNDVDKTAKDTVNELQRLVKENYQLYYHSFSKKGLANVRNELIKRALKHSPEFIVFIDDDEYASEFWLTELLNTLIVNKGDMAVGRVVSVFDEEVPEYISHWFERGGDKDGAPIGFVISGNLIIKTAFIESKGIRFDYRFNTTGGEDTYFGIEALRNGAKIFWAQNAVAYEVVPKNRTKLDWLVKRRYRGAITFTYILILDKEYGRLIRKATVSFFNLIVGIGGLPLLLFPFKWRYWGILKLAEGCGGFAGLLNVKYHEYK